jgi:hypothetical protein
VLESVKPLVVSAFTWPAAGLFKISSRPPRSATLLSWFGPFDNTLSELPGGAVSKTLREIKKRPTDLPELRERGTILISRHPATNLRTISTSDELTRLDLFSLSGEASKAFFAMTEPGAVGLKDLGSLEAVIRLGDRLYGNRAEWETVNLQDVDFSKFSLLFLFMRLNVFRNEPQDRTLEETRILQRRLGLGREEEAGMQSTI